MVHCVNVHVDAKPTCLNLNEQSFNSNPEFEQIKPTPELISGDPTIKLQMQNEVNFMVSL